ncbi:putative SAM dependent methyltransferase [Dactylonectria estremocensis]|uniref:SAM dependent methyltransferase n=1 Tax=Dactylonectria estremocensis TaxID=1079267 RepID=A0A9P9IJ43_9HYPO|nr:putative SAM dependent methyltransferase [Dactylonectria estremocensis]
MSSPKSASATSPARSPRSPEQTEELDPAHPTNTQIPFNEHDDDVDSAIGDNESITSSTASLTDSIFDYRTINGRTFQSSKTTEYWGPNDDKQNNGLDIAHHFMTMIKDDKLFLAPIGDVPKKVLDVGTGTGIWAIDMADAYPSTEVIGTDISPIQPGWVPPNCSFHLDDAQLEWTYPPGTFDFVHIRALYGCIDNWTELYRQAHKALVPGGYLEDFEMTITLYSDLPEIRDDPEHIFKKWSKLFLEAMDRIGKTGRIGVEGNMRKHMEKAGYVDIVERSYQVPVGGWSSDPKQKKIGTYNLAFLDESLEGFALFLLKQIMGFSYEEVQVFVAKMRNAIRNTKIRPYYLVTNVFARKPDVDDV